MRQLTFDLGNSFIKYAIDNQAPKLIRSLRSELSAGVNQLPASEQSPVVSYLGKTYHYGERAKDYRSKLSTVYQEKVDAIVPAIFCALPPSSEEHISLVTFHPRPTVALDSYLQQLQGNHFYSYNGRETSISISQIEVLAEGYGAYLQAKNSGLVNEGYTIVIDLGYGTAISRLYNEEGLELASEVAEKTGVFALASSIASDKRLANALGTQPDVSVVMEGMRKQHRYGYLNVSWADYFDQHLEAWFSKVVSQVQASYSSWFENITTIVIAGGGCELVKDFLADDDFFVCLPEPQLANVLGVQTRKQLTSTVANITSKRTTSKRA